jgi:hypothetical protein
MKRKKTIYIGGEQDKQEEIMPRRVDRFFDKRLFFVVVGIVFLLLLALLTSV